MTKRTNITGFHATLLGLFVLAGCSSRDVSRGNDAGTVSPVAPKVATTIGAEIATPPPAGPMHVETVTSGPSIGQFAVYATQGLQMVGGAWVKGCDVGVQRAASCSSDVTASLAGHATIDTTRTLFADSVDLGGQSSVGVVDTNHLTSKGGASHGAVSSFPSTMPAPPAMPSASAGTTNVTVGSGSQTLAPGAYGDVTVGAGAKLVLSGGSYTFASLSMNASSLVVNGTTSLAITGGSNIHGGCFVGPASGSGLTAKALTVYSTSTSDVHLNSFDEFHALIAATNATVIVDTAQFYGAIAAAQVRLNAKAVVTCEGGFGPPSSCDDGNPCTTDSSVGSACTHVPVADGTSCNDGNACTKSDTCQSGACVGASPVSCTPSDACHVAGSCDKTTGTCSNPVASDGTSCDDGNANTTGDVCTGGVCAGVDHCVGVTCIASDACHVAGVCDHATGACTNPSAADGKACDDHDPNTVGDVCTAGVCAGVDHCKGVTCAASDQCHVAGTCDHSTGLCSNPAAPNGTVCSDGNACTRTDSCQAGICTGASPVSCAASDQCHVAGTCDATTGTCSNPSKADGTTCNDGNASTVGDVCTAGVCAGIDHCVGVTCAASDQCHVAGTCDHATGTCSNPIKANGSACDDGNASTVGDACTAGVCAGVDRCVGVTCVASDQCHAAGTCDHATGACSNPAKADGTTCNDGNANTVEDVCTAGLCAGVDHCIGVSCAASDQCHSAGACDHATGACSNPTKTDGTTCNDGNADTVGDVCTAGVCAGVDHCAGVTCTAKDQCHAAGTCDHATGACSNPTVANGTTCDDSNANTVGDVCTAGVCVGVDHCVGVTCGASDQCHSAGTCDHATGACSNPAKTDGTACNDGNANTVGDVCTAGVCAGVDHCVGVTCSPSDQCHSTGTCDHATGTCSNPPIATGTSCDDGNANTFGDVCTAGVCAGVDHCLGVTCAASDQCHDAGTCDHSTGVCSNPKKADGTTCNDGNANTVGDLCMAGVCAGVDHCVGVTCAASDQCHVAGTCDHTTGTCSNPAKTDGTTCNDGNADTFGDICTAGVCAGVDHCLGVSCAAKDQCHAAGICDHATGACSNPAVANGTTCDDGNTNTVGDVCTAGVCSGIDHCIGVTCTASDQCHVAGSCDHATGACSNPTKADGSSCNDANANTVDDVCTAGVCSGVDHCVGVTCAASDQCHSAGTCDHATGTCSNPTKANGTTCDDGNADTVGDVCTAGVCTGIDHCVGVTCTAKDQCHSAGTCDHATGACSNPAVSNGTTCDDSNANTVGDVCTAGVCAGIDHCIGVTCAASDLCHSAGTCDHATGACSNPAKTDGTTCNDGNADTVGDVCTAGVCAGVDHCLGVTCAAKDQCHAAGTCDHATGTCSNPVVANGTTCDDGNTNTVGDVCTAGVCAGVDHCIGVTCAPSDQCHVAGACDHATGACSNPTKTDGSSCNDANANTVDDVCTAGVCSGVDHCVGVTCAASDQCHSAGTCDHATGSCSNPTKANGTTCDDGSADTVGDVCTAGVCAGVDHCIGVTCTAKDQCHAAGTCDHGTGACSNPAVANGTSCDDSNSNTVGDVCTAGVCAGVDHCIGVTCAASDQCHSAGTCDHATGACSNPTKSDGTTCNDGNANTVGDVCTAGTCAGVDHCVGVTCTASDQCHSAGSCDHATGTCSNPIVANGTTCDDGNANTVGDVCTAGACAGVDHCVGVTCTAKDQCHSAGTCDHATGACSNPAVADGTTCNDANANTVGDICTAGLCAGVDHCIGVTCAARDQCHSAGICDHATGACSNPTKTDGTTCNDGNTDTVGDVCTAGVCAGVDHCVGVTCTAKDQCHVVGTCDHATGTCSNPNAANGTTCDDANANTVGDICTAGVCAGVDHCVGVTCAASDQCHVAGTCDHATGACSNPTKTDGTTCNDGNTSTVGDVCTAGVCAGIDHCVGVTCAASDQCHVAGTCDHATGTCSNPNAPNGRTCDDSNANTVGDVCSAGVCAGVDHCIGVTCAASDQCHDAGTCDHATGACSNPKKTDGTTCNDGNANTVGDTCTAGVCAGVDHCIGVTCTASDQCHVAGTCDHATGACSNPTKADGTTCNDSDANTVGDVCTAGVCAGVDHCIGVTCTASDQCHTVGTCDHATGKCSNPTAADGALCDDSNGCTKVDTCKAGVCVGASPLVCAAPDQCHAAGACDVATGKCVHPVLADGTACNDGNLCTQTDSCQAGTCTGSNPVACTASDTCHVAGTCDAATGSCTNPVAPNSSGCKDGVPVNQAPVVDAGPDRTVAPGSVTLTGTVTDDGLPAPVTTNWLQVDGPATVPFTDGSKLSITAPFTKEGVYTFRLKASDTQLVSSDDVVITVKPAGSGTTIKPGTDPGTTTGLARDGSEIKLDTASWNFNFLWVPVTTKGTIVKIDSDSGAVLGEYWTAPQGQAMGPSRTTVDQNGSVWVANRDGRSVARIALKEAGKCVDKNHNGVIDTSTGLGDVKSWNPAGTSDVFGGVTQASDECIVNYTLVASYGARHVTVDGNNDVWVSGTSTPGRSFDLLDGITGAIKRHELDVGYGGFGGLIDDHGVLWSAHPLLRWDPVYPLKGVSGTNWKGYDSSWDTYGLCKDSQGNVWSTSSTSTKLQKIAPTGEILAEYDRGLADAKSCVADRNDHIWLTYGEGADAKVAHLTNDGVLVGSVTAGSGANGLSRDARGKIWTTNCVGNTASRIDPSAGPMGPDGTTPIGATDFTTVDLGGSPFGYSDMSGSIRASGPGVGSWTGVFNSGVATSQWGQAQWSSWICGNASLKIQAASSTDGTTYSTAVTASNGTQFTLPNGPYLKVTASFTRSSKGETPTLTDITVATKDRPLAAKSNAAPVVSAGLGFTTTLPNVGHVVGSVCDDGLPNATLVTSWSKVSGPGSVSFASPSSEVSDVTFGAPGTYVLRITGNDGQKSSTSDVTVTVLVANNPPTVTAGPDIAITLPSNATLTATATDDGQPTTGSLTTNWTKVSGPGNVTFATPTASTTTATFDAPGDYVVRFTAFDSLLSSSADVRVTVNDAPPANQPPIVKAGTNVTSNSGDVVTLTGFVTDDGLPVGSVITQQWTQVSGPGTATFGSPSSLSTTVTFSADGTYVLRLTASDSQLSSSSDLGVVVQHTVIPGSDGGTDVGSGTSDPPITNAPPTVNAGPNLAITLPASTVTLSGSTSDDGLPSGTLTQQWTKVSGPGTVTFGSPTAATTTATMSAAGSYVLRLSASDGQFSAAADVQVLVRSAAIANLAPVVKAGAGQTITLPNRTVTLAGTVTDDGKPAGATLTSTWMLVSGPSSVTFGTPTAMTTLASFNSAGTYTLRLKVSDSELEGSGDTIVTVLPAKAINTAPTIVVGPPQTITYPATTTAALSATVTDDGLPVGGTLQTQWLQVSGPAVATLADNVATFTALGDYSFRVYAFDGELMSTGLALVSVVAPTPVNKAPVVSVGLAQTVTQPNAAKLSGSVSDDGLPASSTLSVQWSVLSGPGSATFAPANAVLCDAIFSAPGAYVVRLTANDGALTASADMSVTVLPENHPPVVNAGSNQTLTFPNKVAALAGTVSDDGLPTGGALTTTWSTVSGPVPARFWHPNQTSTNATFLSPGTYVLRLTASDSDKTASSDVTVTVTAPSGSLPVVAFADGTDGQQITKPTPISGSVSSGAWTLDVALGDADSATFASWRTIASGSNVVTNGVLGTLDPTVMLNGGYTLRLRSTTDAGSAETFAGVTIARNMKVGTFALAFNDLVVPAPGLLLQIQRTYDNRDKSVGDFGVGWNLGVKNIRVEKSVNLGKSWYQSRDDSGFFTEYAIEPIRDPNVTVTFPNGKAYQFQMQASPAHQTLYPIGAVDVSFAPINGTVGSLVATEGSDLTLVPGSLGIPGPCSLQNLSLEIWNPTRFTLTDEDGVQYTVNQVGGVEEIRDLDGNVLTVTPGGLKHSSGRNVTFKRDDKGRITEVIDPNGKSMKYGYDTYGNLAAFTNAAGETQSYAYDDQHNMTATTDGRGVTPANYGYDAAGRLTGVTDAFGHQTQFTHDVDNKTETVTDAVGATTVYKYDDDGNVVRKVDALGGVWTNTYDSNDNVLSETDALGNTKTYTYDANNNKLTETDALGHTTSYTYGRNRKMTSRTDALGRKTVYKIDFYATHVDQQTDPAGGATSYYYNKIGLLETVTNPVGAVTTYLNDPYAGVLGGETDALGHTATYKYDAKGQRISETKVRTRLDGTTENVVTAWEYDDAGRVKKTTYADGSTTSMTYDKAGKPLEQTDQKGRVTKHAYDSLGRALSTTYPDGTSDSTTYDAVGHVATRTDRGGRVTTYGYDLAGRQTSVTYADGSSTLTTYDAAGRVLSTTNENGHTTTYGYDASGRRISVTDALGNATTMAYDAAGQLTSTTDPLGHSTSYTYDAAGRTLRTTYADGTHDDATYDLAGQRLTKTDQAGITTSYGYDLLGHLTTVTDALGHVTKYAYDELGQKTSQTDANAHTTKYSYDSMGRRVSKILPMGQFDQTVYDVVGNVLSHTDNNGKVTTFTYDANNRVITRTPEASFGEVATSWSYLPSGMRATMVDVTGTTTYTYDARDRLLKKETPEGTLFYVRDAMGHVKTMRSEKTDGVAVDYAWDSNERLSTVTDRGPDTGTAGKVTTYGYDTAGRMLGWTQPNGVVTAFTYDTANRLANVGITNAAGTTLASYMYTLSPTGNRLGVTEGSGRTIAWTYDTLYRLTSETITGAVSANGAIAYTYDNVGNRLTRTSTVPGIAATTTTHDANDRTVGDSWNANGDMLTREGRTQGFDSLDRLSSSTPSSGPTVHVYYDGDGNRVAVDVGGTAASYLVDDQNPTGHTHVVEERVSGAVEKAWVFGKTPIAQKAASGSAWRTNYYGLDGHGSVTSLIDSVGAITDTWEYDGFGNVVARTGTTPNAILYSGEWMDADLGLQYLRARWYSPRMGRFVSSDTWEMGLRGGALPRYVYGNANPIGFVDPSGHDGDLPSENAVVAITSELATEAVPGLATNLTTASAVAGGITEASSAAAALAVEAGPTIEVVAEGTEAAYEIGQFIYNTANAASRGYKLAETLAALNELGLTMEEAVAASRGAYSAAVLALGGYVGYGGGTIILAKNISLGGDSAAWFVSATGQIVNGIARVVFENGQLIVTAFEAR